MRHVKSIGNKWAQLQERLQASVAVEENGTLPIVGDKKLSRDKQRCIKQSTATNTQQFANLQSLQTSKLRTTGFLLGFFYSG